jgi:hypothetical protein
VRRGAERLARARTDAPHESQGDDSRAEEDFPCVMIE